MKNKILKEHFLNPRNMGFIENPSFQSIAKSETCNDIVKMTMLVETGIIKDIKTEVFGCGYSISGTSFFTDLIKGNHIETVLDQIDQKMKELQKDIPDSNISCVNLSKKAFLKILGEYQKGAK